MQKPERSIDERAEEVYRSAYYSVMPAGMNRKDRRTAHGRMVAAQAEAAAHKARADYLEEELGMREGCKVVVEATKTSLGTEITDTRVVTEGLDNTHPDWNNARNWTEDYLHDNGQYMNRCMTCRRIFCGHKRRVVCKTCAESAPKQLELGL